MAVLLNYLYGDKLPLRAVSDHVSVVPKEGCTIVTTGWPKLLFFFNADPLVCLSEGARFTVSRGDTLILRGENPIRFFPGDGVPETRLHVLAVYFETPLHAVAKDDPRWDVDLEEYLRSTFTRNSLLRASDAPELWPLALRLRAECENLQSYRQGVVCELARQWTLRIAELSGLQKGHASSPEQLLTRRAIAHLAARDFQGSVQDLSRSLGVPSTALQKAFVQHSGLSLNRYLQWLSIEWAKLLLLQSNLSMVQVARRLRYGSTSAFCRAFRARTGLSPRSYRGTHDGASTVWVAKASSQDEPAQFVSPPVSVPRWQRCEGKVRPSTVSLLWCLEGKFSVRRPGRKVVELSASQGMLVLSADKAYEVRLSEEQSSAILLEGPAEAKALNRWSEWQPRFDLNLLRPLLLSGPQNRHERLWIESHLRLLWLDWFRFAMEQSKASTQPNRTKPSHKLLIQQACDFMQKHFRDSLSLDEIAHAVGVSGEHLARIFRTEHGQTVMNQLFATRIYHAKKTLLRSADSLDQIAELSGFTTTSHFCRIFKEHTALTPTEYRARRIAEI